jgi:hypothetical protein
VYPVIFSEFLNEVAKSIVDWLVNDLGQPLCGSRVSPIYSPIMNLRVQQFHLHVTKRVVAYQNTLIVSLTPKGPQ